MSQEELAFRAEMNVTYLSDLERGRWNPSLAMIVDLAIALDVHPSELLRGLTIGMGSRAPKRKRPRSK
jgi:transcriptional regulator with XRE-family HTH domain